MTQEHSEQTTQETSSTWTTLLGSPFSPLSTVLPGSPAATPLQNTDSQQTQSIEHYFPEEAISGDTPPPLQRCHAIYQHSSSSNVAHAAPIATSSEENNTATTHLNSLTTQQRLAITNTNTEYNSKGSNKRKRPEEHSQEFSQEEEPLYKKFRRNDSPESPMR